MAHHHQPSILYPKLPYVGKVEGGLTSGKMVRIQGRIPVDSSSFAINYQLGPSLNPRDDIALHVSPRFDEGIIIRNHIQSMAWGPQEAGGPMLLQRGKPFDIIILCDYQCFKIAINGKHFDEFAHRLPYSRVSHMVIDGEVEISCISYEMISTPTPSAPVHDDPINIGPPAPGGLYPTLNLHEKQQPPPTPDGMRNNPGEYKHQPKPQKFEEKTPSASGFDKVGLAVGGLVAAGGVAAAMHAYKKSKKKYEQEGNFQKPKTPMAGGGLGGLGTLGAALATGLASNALQKGLKVPAQQGYPSPNPKGDVLGSFLGALGGAGKKFGGSPYKQPYTNPPNEAYGSMPYGGAGHHQQYHQYPPAGSYGGYPQSQTPQWNNGSDSQNGLGGALFKTALGGLSAHVSQKVEKKLAKEISKNLSQSLNLTPRKA